MTTVQRYDRGELKSAVRTDEGYLLAEGFAARPGVLEYRQADGSIRRELVTEEELHRADSLETLARKPVTLEHPTGEAGEQIFVAPENIQEFGVGDVAEAVEVERLNGFVKIRMAVRRKDAVAAIDQGIRELSAGYTVDLDMTPGEHPVYGRYDAVQRNRKYNHVAIVPMGRAGSSVALRADSAVQISPFQPGTTPQQERLMSDVKKTVQEELARRDADEKAKKLADENEELKKKIDELQGKLDALTKKAEDAPEEDEKKADSAADRLAWFKERTDALSVAQKMGLSGLDGADVPQIKQAVVKAHLGDGMRADASDAYFDAAYDIVKAQVEKKSQQDAYSGLASPAVPAPGHRQDSALVSPEDAFLANMNKHFSR